MKLRILLLCAVTLMLISLDLANSRDNESVEHTLAPPRGVSSAQVECELIRRSSIVNRTELFTLYEMIDESFRKLQWNFHRNRVPSSKT